MNAVADEDLDDLEKYAPLIPLFGAMEELFGAWESAVRDLELETEEPVWTRKPNRQMIREARRGYRYPRLRRSRIRRRINRVARQKGWYK